MTRVFTIPPSVPFLETLAHTLLNGSLIPNFPKDISLPFAIADVTIFLPTRRAARILQDILSEKAGQETLFLPTIRPIGDMDEASFDLREHAQHHTALPPMIDPMERQLLLAELIHAFAWRLRNSQSHILAESQSLNQSEEPIRLPSSAADALWLAQDLAALIDTVATEECSWNELRALVPDDYATYWQFILKFLDIAVTAWPKILHDKNQLDPAKRRSILLDAQASHLLATPPTGPVIAAGSTGSIPATARLLKVIANLPNGAVILPGLDQDLDDKTWQAINLDPRDPKAASNHPQYSLKQLLTTIGITREDVLPLGEKPNSQDSVKAYLISHAMRPAHTTDEWHTHKIPHEQSMAAFADTTLIEARNEIEEALAIALVARQGLAEDLSRIHIVTPDRGLAYRIRYELKRWSLDIDDSAGTPLSQTPPGIFIRLILDTIASGFEAVTLLSLLKHPLAAFGLQRAEALRRARLLEIDVLRSSHPTYGLDSLRMNQMAATIEAEQTPYRIATVRQHLSVDERANIAQFIDQIEICLKPLIQIIETSPTLVLRDIIPPLLNAVRSASNEGTEENVKLFTGDAGETLAEFFNTLLQSDEGRLRLEKFEIASVIDVLMSTLIVRQRHGTDSRIHILGPMEARLQQADLVIIAALNEEIWPANLRADPWLSRSMRTTLGLAPPERRLGLAAHDFTQMLGTQRLVLSRALKKGTAPSVISRWLRRLLTVLGPSLSNAMRIRGNSILRLAYRIDQPQIDHKPAERPNPKPPLHARPKRLSISQIETWIRDPYAIYARKTLCLEPIDPIAATPHAGFKGTLIHDSLARFSNEWSGPFDNKATLHLIEIGHQYFRTLDAFPAEKAFWWPRFIRIAKWFIAWEQQRTTQVSKRLTEIDGQLEIIINDIPFLLTGRADRIDLMQNKTISLIDFKTGYAPSKHQVTSGLAPQLPLEAAMIQHNAFKEPTTSDPISALSYIVLKGGFKAGTEIILSDDTYTPIQLANDAMDRLRKMISIYQNPMQGYLSRARVKFEADRIGDYDHLARVKEWVANNHQSQDIETQKTKEKA